MSERGGHGRRWAGALTTVAAVVLALVLMVPVVLLPVSTLAPIPLWVALLVADLALLVCLVVGRRRPGVRPIAVVCMAVVAVIAVVASQVLAATPPITGADGRPVPGSIATLEKVTLNGSEQWVTIRGHDVANPVLLNLGMGGPGGGGFATRSLFTPLEERFTVVAWDEPGTGKSYGAVPFDQLTKERFVSDAVALTNLLRQRFGHDKVYLYGVSWSSILGIWLIQEHPEFYHALVSTSQMVNTTENDRAGYQLALQHVEQLGDTRTAEKLRRNGPPPYEGANVVFRYLDYLDILNDMMGQTRYAVIVPIIPFLAPEYGLVDKVNHTRGLIDSFNAVYPQLRDLDFKAQATELDVPVYFFVGRQDVNALASLVEEYHAALNAPHKELNWFDGGHGLDGDSMGQFVDILINRVRRDN